MQTASLNSYLFSSDLANLPLFARFYVALALLGNNRGNTRKI